MRVAAYARYSSDLQRESSIDDQVRNCRRRAAADGWEIATIFADKAITGTNANRPAYQRMLAAAARQEFDVLVVDDLSRFSRDSVEQERAIRRMEFQQIRIVSASDGYDSTSKARKMHRGFKGLMNEIFIDDLRDKVHRGLAGQAEKGRWCGGRPYGYKLKPIFDPNRLDPYGQPERIATVLEIDEQQAAFVRLIFERYAEGASCLTIAAELNEAGVASPGSTWRREVRRCKGWINSSVRSILRNPLYTGVQHWNTSQYLRDPDTGKDRRRARPRAEWTVSRQEHLRIVSDELFQRAQSRTRARANPGDARLKAGGKAKYLLSGLLTCGRCGSHYVLHDKRSYACSGHAGGRACTNSTRVRRSAIEAAILDPLRDDLLSPARIERMARKLQQGFAAQLQEQHAKAEERPKEIRAIEARIERLRERQRKGDEDMTGAELDLVIESAEADRQRLLEQQPAAKESAKVLVFLPRAAAEYRKQIALALDGHSRATEKARHVLRQLLGPVKLIPEGTELWAEYSIEPGNLIKVAGAGTWYRGRGI
jgi:site-specific DNA recombinase